MEAHIWKGIFPALTTPFTQHDTLDLPLFNNQIQAQLNAGVHGIFCECN
jgi:4-hydroxy-tetrahydrodipicolinate synthase